MTVLERRRCWYRNDSGICECEDSPCHGKLCLTCGKYIGTAEVIPVGTMDDPDDVILGRDQIAEGDTIDGNKTDL